MNSDINDSLIRKKCQPFMKHSVFNFLAEKHRGFAFIEFELAEVNTEYYTVLFRDIL